MNEQEIHRMQQLAGIAPLCEGAYDTALRKKDKWFPEDPDVQDEYYTITDPKKLADWFKTNAREQSLNQLGFRGNYLELATTDLKSRKKLK